jgi:N-acetylneuraminic acid mutarotase
MNRSTLSTVFLIICALVFGALGCKDVAGDADPTDTTTPPGSTTLAAVTTTSTTTPPLTRWAKTDPKNEPPGRMYHAMACDTSTGKVYLFGGSSGDALSERVYGGLLVYEPVTGKWTALDPAGQAPAARHGHAMTYDPSTGKVLLFGGISKSGTYLDDLWAYDPASDTWTELDPAGDTPDARSWTTMVYDSKNGKIMLFGGTGRRLVPFDEFTTNEGFSDLWSYDPTANAWTDLNPTGDRPGARSQYSMAYDSCTGKIILFGGFQEPSREPVPLDDLWSYDPTANAWTELDQGLAPVRRGGAAMVYDPGSQLSILFGGYAVESDNQYPETLWAYDSAASVWRRLDPTARIPYGRSGHVMVYDPKIGGIIMFGGFSTERGYLSGTWTLTP